MDQITAHISKNSCVRLFIAQGITVYLFSPSISPFPPFTVTHSSLDTPPVTHRQTGKNEQARRYLSKATTLDRVFGPAWVAYGHSFAAENEHDQAMAAYFKAAQLMKGCHLPLLYIGMEYGLTNNPKFAEKFFREALEIAPSDPFVLHELGVVAFSNQE